MAASHYSGHPFAVSSPKYAHGNMYACACVCIHAGIDYRAAPGGILQVLWFFLFGDIISS